jgi:hypothetical protein
MAKPFVSIAAAVEAAAGKADTTIVLREGTFHEQQIHLGPEHSGLTIQNHNGEHAIVSGAVPLDCHPEPVWEPVNTTSWNMYPGINNIFGRCGNPNSCVPDVEYLGRFDTLAACEAVATANVSFQSFTWHDPAFHAKQFASHCYGTLSIYWHPEHTQANVISGRLGKSNIWALNLSHISGLEHFHGLRLNGSREIRAKYPNGNPETPREGWVTSKTEWLLPDDKFTDGSDKWDAAVDIISNGSMWPGVHWPMASDLGDCREMQEDGVAGCGNFHIGSGGFCSDLDPPVGYWCSKQPPRGQAYNHTTRATCGGKHHSCGGTQMHMSPAGVVYSSGNVLPNAPKYKNATGAMVQAWRGLQHWYTNGCLVKSHDIVSGTLYFDQEVGCNQGGEGMVRFVQVYPI